VKCGKRWMKNFKHTLATTWQKKFSKVTSLVLAAVLFGGFGSYLLLASHAATPTASLETENGTLSSKVSGLIDTTASGGHAVKFGSADGGSCAVSTPNVPDGPDPWGGCFPGPTTTGPNNSLMLASDKKTLTNWTGGCSITTDNLVIDSKIINCPGGIGISAVNVTIKNSQISEYIVVDTDTNSNWSLTLKDSEISGGHYDLPTVGNGNITMIRVKAHGGHNGLQCDEHSKGCTIRDSYIYGQEIVNPTDPHLGGILTDGGPVGMTIAHNSVTCDATNGCTGDINLIPNFATAQNITISNNLMGASINGSYCTYGGEKPTSPYPHANHIVYQNNIFQRGNSNLCAVYGPVGDFDIMQPGNVWTNNKYADGTAILCRTTDECL
jgi:hypothetical protein